MGFCGRLDVGDEWSEVLHVETTGEQFGDCLDDARTGLFNQVRDYGDSENAGLERLLCPAEAPELFISNRDASDQSIVPEDSCVEATCSESFGNASIENQLGDIVSSQSEDFAHLNSCLDQKVSLVGKDEPEDVHGIVSVLDKVTNSDEGNQSRSLESTKESYLDDEQAQSENASLERLLCSAAAPKLFNSNWDAYHQSIVQEDSCLEAACSTSFGNASIENQFGDIVFSQSEDFTHLNSSIDQKVSLVGNNEPVDVHEIVSVLDKVAKSDEGNQSRSLVSTKESYLDDEQAQFEGKMGNSTQNGETALALPSLLFASSRACTRVGDNTVNVNLLDPSDETDSCLLGFVEEQQDFSSRTRLISQTLHLEGTTCNLIGEKPTIASDCAVEVSTSSQLSQLCGVVDVNSSVHLVPDDPKRDDCSGTLTCSDLLDSTAQPGTIEKDSDKPDFDPMLTCSDSLRSSHRKSTRQCKSNQVSQTRKNTKQRKMNNKKLFPGQKIGISLKFVRRKRSFQSKRARTSVWGAFGNIMQVFAENDSLPKHDTQLVQIENHRPPRRRGVQGIKKQQKTLAGGSSPVQNTKNCASTSRIRLRVKVGGHAAQGSLEVLLPKEMDSQASLPTIVGEYGLETNGKVSSKFSKVTNSITHKLGENVHAARQVTHLEGGLGMQVGACLLDSDQGDKSLESAMTLDASVGNSLGDCSGVASQTGAVVLDEAVDNQYSYPGTSPDSEVVNSIQDAGIGARIHEDLNDVVLSSSHAVLGPIDEAAIPMEHMKMKKGKKNGKVKEPLRGGFSVERKSLDRGSRNNSRKLSKRKSGQKVGCVPTPSDAFILERVENASSKSSGFEIYPAGSFPGSEIVELGEMLKVETVTESSELSTQDVPAMPAKSSSTGVLYDSGKSVGPTLPKCPKSKAEISKRKSRASDSSRRRRGNACREKKKDVQKSTNKSKVKENGFLDQHYNEENDPETNSGSLKHPKSGRPAESNGINAFECNIFNDLGKCKTDSKFACEDTFKPSSLITSELDDQFLPPQRAWVRCDECHKWRCISVTLANSIEETNCSWTCKDNMDKAFADCSIPQEKSNAEINAELEISDASGEEDASNAYPSSEGFKRKQVAVPVLAPWKSIKSNLFLHRSRKTQTIDEIMVCHCKPPQDGSLGCGDECLNRMLNIECVRGTCSSGDLCSNQQFQKRKYSKLKSFPCGKKGHGLQLLEDVSRGAFLIEYVGEVLDLNAYEARQREYAAKGQKHFYFMTLNGSEVIDACAKGNLGRFINHSCDPNCRTEKWMVNGEVCIGLFAIRDIKKGEEVTFDYNYVRVFGAAAKRCVCGSAECQGYIGGDPSNTEAVVQGDSDEEYPEPVMVDKVGDSDDNLDKMIYDGVQAQHADRVLESSGALIKSPSAIGKPGMFKEKEDAVGKSPSALGQTKDSLEKEESIRKSSSAFQPLEVQQTYALELLEVTSLEENTTNKTMPARQTPEASSVATAVANAFAVNSKLIHNTEEHKPSVSKAHPVAKSSRSSSSIKKGKSSSYPVTPSKHQVLTNKPKKMLEGAASSRLDGVEEKLKDLLDFDGGISRRKDATKGYLKLLFLTAASGDNLNGEAVQSTRDLSIILDAFLKTKSRMVLVDIINKNGFQMLHTIMMQNRKNFNRTPIIRKLLKVLEFLAQRDILTLEHINSGPPCAGKESFKESIIQLTRHNDVQVHQIARNFRDRWIPRNTKRSTYTDRDDLRLELQNGQNCNRLSAPYKWQHNQSVKLTEAFDCISQVMIASTSLDTNYQEAIDGCSTNGKKGRKRKSRWDQPSETKQNQNLPDVLQDHRVKQKLGSNLQHLEIEEVAQQAAIEVNKEKIYNSCNCSLSQQAEARTDINAMQCSHEDAPPGFPPPLNSDTIPFNAFAAESVNSPVQNIHHGNCAYEVFTGHLQERYLSHLPVSYGIPLTFVNRLGTPLAESLDSWKVAPSIPFHPFPPLPRIPRDRSKIVSPAPAATMNGPKEFKPDCHHASDPLPEDRGISGVSGARPPDIAATGAHSQHTVEQMRCTSGSLSRRYFRQQKWNNCKYGPQWPGKRNPLGLKTSNSRSGMQSGLGNVDHNVGSFSCPEVVSDGREHISSTLYQHSQCQHNH